jgi:amidase
MVAGASPATAACLHNHNMDRDVRVMLVNGKPVSYSSQLFWSELTNLCYLPPTAAPLGLSAAGLPVGCQFVGAESDGRTIYFARLLAEEIGGFVAPPGYA